jgi:hypothetical protein
MHEHDFWTGCAEAMEMSIEGNRLIAREIADAVHELSRRIIQTLERLLPRLTQHRHRPRV